jgi:mono/diheme cytochrome c family protein
LSIESSSKERVMKPASTAVALLPLALAACAAQAQERGAEELARGKEVFDYWCATCHSAGNGMPGTAALQAKYNGNPPALLLERFDLTPDLVKFFVRNGVSVMPHFRKTEIGDADLDALAAYIVTTAKR